jgi:hypothetical protein
MHANFNVTKAGGWLFGGSLGFAIFVGCLTWNWGVDAAEQRRLAHIAAHVLFFAFCYLGNGIFNWVANSESTRDFGY